MSNYNNIVNEGGEGYVPDFAKPKTSAKSAAQYPHHQGGTRTVYEVECMRDRAIDMYAMTGHGRYVEQRDANVAWLAARAAAGEV